MSKKIPAKLERELDSQVMADESAFFVGSSTSPTLDQLVTRMKQLGGPDYDFGAEEWDLLLNESLDDLIKSMDEAGTDGYSETIDWGPDRGSEIIDDNYSLKSAEDLSR